MRERHHLFDGNGDILIADPNSAPGKYGLNHPDYYEPTDPNFLAPVLIQFGANFQEAYLLSEPCPPVCVTNRGDKIGDGFAAVEERQPGGGFSEGLVHKSRIIRYEAEKAELPYELMDLLQD